MIAFCCLASFRYLVASVSRAPTESADCFPISKRTVRIWSQLRDLAPDCRNARKPPEIGNATIIRLVTTLLDKPNDAVLRMLPHDADNLTMRLNLTVRASPILATTPEKLAARSLRLWLFVIHAENEFVNRTALMFVVRFCGQHLRTEWSGWQHGIDST